MSEKRKVKGGAAKVRDKRRKQLEMESEKCAKISQFFPVTLQSQPLTIPDTPSASTSVQVQSHQLDLDPISDAATATVESTSHLEIEPPLLPSTSKLPDTLIPEIIESPAAENVIICQNYFERPETSSLQQFFEYHPKQPFSGPLPFSPNKVFFA